MHSVCMASTTHTRKRIGPGFTRGPLQAADIIWASCSVPQNRSRALTSPADPLSPACPCPAASWGAGEQQRNCAARTSFAAYRAEGAFWPPTRTPPGSLAHARGCISCASEEGMHKHFIIASVHLDATWTIGRLEERSRIRMWWGHASLNLGAPFRADTSLSPA